jgi:hypothetical protein
MTAPDSFVEQALNLADNYGATFTRKSSDEAYAALRAHLERHAARCKELEEDAARYRFLKDAAVREQIGVGMWVDEEFSWLYGNEADAKTDAARSALSAPKEQST